MLETGFRAVGDSRDGVAGGTTRARKTACNLQKIFGNELSRNCAVVARDCKAKAMPPRRQNRQESGPAVSNSLKDMLDLEKQFVFYASYHHNAVNIAIHLLCIWQIAATAVVFLQHTPAIAPMPEALGIDPGLKVNAALLVCIFYSIVYLVMEPFIGLLGKGGALRREGCRTMNSFLLIAATGIWLVIYYQTGIWVASNAIFFGLPVWKVALIVHVSAWILQFVGHGVFEKRAPALLDSLHQALITAPLFVLLEVVFFFGYRKEFHDKCMAQVERNVRAFKNQRNE